MKVKELFEVTNARSKAFEDHELGDVAFVTNGFSNNGVIGFVQPLPKERVFNFRGICLSAFCEATVHEPPFLPRGNGGSGLVVLKPRDSMAFAELLYYASCINKGAAWKFSYGKMIRKDRAEEIELPKYEPSIKLNLASILPRKAKTATKSVDIKKWGKFLVTDLFTLERGDFHAIDDLDLGHVLTVSRVGVDNGVIGLYEPPQGAKVYTQAVITVSTVTGDAFVQIEPFMATDNVVICVPKKPLCATSLYFIQFVLNSGKWRYSYGRQCYKTKFAQTILYLPITETGEPAESLMGEIVKNTSYWPFLQKTARALIED